MVHLKKTRNSWNLKISSSNMLTSYLFGIWWFEKSVHMCIIMSHQYMFLELLYWYVGLYKYYLQIICSYLLFCQKESQRWGPCLIKIRILIKRTNTIISCRMLHKLTFKIISAKMNICYDLFSHFHFWMSSIFCLPLQAYKIFLQGK